ncbi:MAG: molybdate ABC transporter substrate-binding protein [Elusimicrobia bacterium]|nr:molybdate ABC transporter substrate-binding protein [Elusimicrobiota bacterium]MBU2615020.1 molybdate ABC transporter substrate-binding protein [Elusimicrobiota bacterium]
MKAKIIILTSFAAMLAVVSCTKVSEKENQASLFVYCGSSMRPPMEEIAKLYEKEKGEKVVFTFGDSGTILIQAEQSKMGDLYVSHEPFSTLTMKKKTADETKTIAYLYPIIAVRKGNPKGIHSFSDLDKQGIRLGLPDSKYSTCGQIVSAMLKKAGLEEAVQKNVVLNTRSSGDLGNALKLGTIDAAVMWDAVAAIYSNEIEIAKIEKKYEIDAITSATFEKVRMDKVAVTVVLLSFSEKKPEAKQFIDFVCSPKGQEIFKQKGFSIQ